MCFLKALLYEQRWVKNPHHGCHHLGYICTPILPPPNFFSVTFSKVFGEVNCTPHIAPPNFFSHIVTSLWRGKLLPPSIVGWHELRTTNSLYWLGFGQVAASCWMMILKHWLGKGAPPVVCGSSPGGSCPHNCCRVRHCGKEQPRLDRTAAVESNSSVRFKRLLAYSCLKLLLSTDAGCRGCGFK